MTGKIHLRGIVSTLISFLLCIQVTFLVAVLVIAAPAQSDPQFHLPVDCDDIHRHDNTTSSGVYTIYPGGPAMPVNVYCDMDTDGGRWTVSTPHTFPSKLL